MSRTFKPVTISLPPELVEVVEELAKTLPYGNKSFVFRVALYQMIWDLQRALEKAIEILEQGGDLEEEISKYEEEDPNLAVNLLTIATSDLSKEEMKDLLAKLKKIDKKLWRQRYYILV